MGIPLSAPFSLLSTLRLANGVWISTFSFFLSLSSTLTLHAASSTVVSATRRSEEALAAGIFMMDLATATSGEAAQTFAAALPRIRNLRRVGSRLAWPGCGEGAGDKACGLKKDGGSVAKAVEPDNVGLTAEPCYLALRVIAMPLLGGGDRL